MNFENKVVIVTGASSGIGEELAFQLARKKAKVVLAARREDLIEKHAAKIRSEGGSALAVAVDVSRRFQVDLLIKRTVSEMGRLDVLINNAGGGGEPAQNTAEKINYCFALNCLIPFYLTRQLFPLLEASPDGRVVNLTSRLHHLVSYDSTDPQGEFLALSSLMAYPYSKMSQLLWTNHLALQNKDSKVAILLADPGTTESPGYQNAHQEISGGITGWLLQLHPIYTSTAQAGRVAVTAALNPEFSGKKGTYLTVGGGIHRAKTEAYHTGNGRKVFEYCKQLSESILNEVTGV